VICTAVWVIVTVMLLIGLRQGSRTREIDNPLETDVSVDRKAGRVVGGAAIATVVLLLILEIRSHAFERPSSAIEWQSMADNGSDARERATLAAVLDGLRWICATRR
jgi:hypothetical protein